MLLTIITVVRNGEFVIERCLKEIASLKDKLVVEHVVIDGQSSDNTVKICAKFDCNVIQQSGLGIYNAMNEGIDSASGKYILFANADDYIDADGLMAAMGILHSDGECNHLFSVKNKRLEKTVTMWNPSATFCRRSTMPAPHPGMIIKRNLYKRELRFDESYKYSADYNMALKLHRYQRVYKVKCHNIIISNFQLGGASSNVRAIIENIRIRYKNNLKIQELLFGFSCDIYRYICSLIVRNV